MTTPSRRASSENGLWRTLFVVLTTVILFVLWTEYAYDKGAQAAQYECEYEDVGQAY